MSVFALQAHPTTPCPFITALNVRMERQPDGGFRGVFEVRGDLSQLDIPPAAAPDRTDGLWRQTCFEIFRRAPGASAYDEFNFSPSGAWAAYRFERYRAGMFELDIGAAPQIGCLRRCDEFVLTATVGAAQRAAEPVQFALAAVLKDQDGKVYYWAIRHPDGKPDFHHEAGFAATLSNP